MPDIAAISGALSSLKVSTDLAKTILGLRDANLVREKVLELNAEIFSARDSALSAQAEQAALLEDIRNLKEQVRKFENWNAEKRRYQLTKLEAGTFAYALKPDEAGGEPPHYICAKCFEDRRKSILQGFGRRGATAHLSLLRCDGCEAEIIERATPYERDRSTVANLGRRNRWLDLE